MKLTWANFNGACRPSGDQVNYQVCPGCGDERWHFYVSPRNGGYHCFKCGLSGYADVDAHALVARWEENMRPEWREIELPSTLPLGPDAERYLAERNVDPQYARSVYGVADWRAKGRIVIPYRDDIGRPIYWVARSYLGEDPKYLKPKGRQPLYTVPHNPVQTSTLVVVEGVFDAWAVEQLGHVAIALVAKTLPYHLHDSMRGWVDPYRHVRVCLDGDALTDGLKLADTIRRWHDDVTVVVLPDGQDPASMPPAELEKLLND